MTLPETGESLLHPRLAFVQLGLIKLADLVGDSQHLHTPPKDFVAQEQESIALALLRRPVEYRLQHAPVGGQSSGQRSEWLPLGRRQQIAVLSQRRIMSWRVSSRL